MAFVGNLLGGYQAKEIGKYNESILQQQAVINTRNAEIKKTTFEQVTLPQLKKDQERNRSNQFVNLLSSGVDVSRIGDTPYLVMLEQSVEDAFDITVQSYNSQTAYENELNTSLILQAQGRGKAFEGEMAFRTGIAKAGADIFMNKDKYKSLLG
mgnify:FL=1|tara:strand:- start:913 stop:1374 length:462 start_codon:yes stop_codon:yes gene_type:complete